MTSDRIEEVETDDAVGVRGVKINHVVRSMAWNTAQDIFDKRAVRVNDCDAVSVLEVGENHIPHQRGLTDAGLAKDCQMLTANIAVDGDD